MRLVWKYSCGKYGSIHSEAVEVFIRRVQDRLPEDPSRSLASAGCGKARGLHMPESENTSSSELIGNRTLVQHRFAETRKGTCNTPLGRGTEKCASRDPQVQHGAAETWALTSLPETLVAHPQQLTSIVAEWQLVVKHSYRHSKVTVFDLRCSMIDVRCSMSDTRRSMFDV